MKRDLSLVRELLLRLEEQQNGAVGVWAFHPGHEELAFEGYDAEEIAYNYGLICDAGLLGNRSEVDASGVLIYSGISWAGHDYLDAVRDPEVWRTTKERAEKVGGWTFGIVKDLAVAYVKQKAVEHGFGL